MTVASRNRRGVASVIGALFMVVIFMVAIGGQMYVSGIQAQSAQATQAAQSSAARKVEELLVYGTPSAGLTVSDSGPTMSRAVAMILQFENGTSYLLSNPPYGANPSFQSALIPAGASAIAQSLVPAGVCSTPSGTATCLSKYSSIVNGQVAGRSVGLVTSLGNTFWYVPTVSQVKWSSLTNFPPGCSANQFAAAVGSPALTCSQVGWSQLSGYPSPCASNQYVSAYGATLTCSNLSLSWGQITGYPSPCPPGQFISQLASTPVCSSASAPSVRITSTQSSSGSLVSSTLAMPLAANTNYVFYAFVTVDCGGCGGLSVAWAVHALPVGASLVTFCIDYVPSGSPGSMCVSSTGSLVYDGSSYYTINVFGVVTMGSASGTLQLDFCPVLGGSGCTGGFGAVSVNAGSFMMADPVA